MISTTGSIYLLFPFIPLEIVIDEVERDFYIELSKRPESSLKKNNRALKIAELFKKAVVSEVLTEEVDSLIEDKRRSIIRISSPVNNKLELFKLGNYNSNHSSNIPQPCITIPIFQVLTL